MTLKTELSNLVSEFRQWRSENYSENQIAENNCDDPSFPAWQKIEDLFEEVIKPANFSSLDINDLENILYLIGRNWDIGSLLNWYNDNLPFHSSQNDLNKEHFLLLAKVAAEVHGVEFIDAKSIIAACFRKFNSLTPEAENVLLRFYDHDNEYIKRQALFSLAKLGYSDITTLLKKSWSIQDEWHKMGCLNIIRTYLMDESLLHGYIREVTPNDGECLSDYIEKLKADHNYR